MKNINMPKLYHSSKYDLDIQTYVPSKLVVDIAETALTMDNQMEQHLCVAVNVIRECTNIDVEKVLDTMDVDVIMYSGLWQEVASHITNLDEIYSYIAHKEDYQVAIAKFFNVTLPEFMDKLDKKLPSGDEWEDLAKKVPQSMNDILKIMKEDGNADIIKGALKLIEQEEEKVGD